MFCIKSQNVNSTIALKEDYILPLKRIGVFEKDSASEIMAHLEELDRMERVNILHSFEAHSIKQFPLTRPHVAFKKFLEILRIQISRMEEERVARERQHAEAMGNLLRNLLQHETHGAMLEAGINPRPPPQEPREVPPQGPPGFQFQPVQYGMPMDYPPSEARADEPEAVVEAEAVIEPEAVIEHTNDNEERDPINPPFNFATMLEHLETLESQGRGAPQPDESSDEGVVQVNNPAYVNQLNMNAMPVLQQISQHRSDINKLIAAIAAADVEGHAMLISGNVSAVDVFEIVVVEIFPWKKGLVSNVSINVQTVQFRTYTDANLRMGFDAETSDESGSSSDD